MRDSGKRQNTHSLPRKSKTAATYSRASYTGTTIGNAAFDGRVREGIGSDHCFMATVKKLEKELASGNAVHWKLHTCFGEQIFPSGSFH